ncbi:MAG: hypothetical protein WCW13_05505 [archaeon]|jgi:hypothetical protein
MYLGNPLLPINITVASAEESIKKKLVAKDWHEYELKPLKLNLVPYFLFNYHYFIENGGDGKSTVKSTVTGVLAIDGHDVKVREDLVELLKHNWKKSSPEIPRGEFHEKWNNVEKREQDEVLQMKTAEYFKIPKQNVVVSNPKKMMLPLYLTTVKIEETEYSLIVNAIDGAISGIKEIPSREKGYMELTRETINELKKPSAWIKYSKEALFDGAGVIGTKISGENGKEASPKKGKTGIDLSFLDSRLVLILIILLGLLLVFMGLFRIRPL